MKKEEELIKFEKGQSYSEVQFYDRIEKYKIHIVEVIDEGMYFCPLVVYRYFGKYKQWWHYEIESAYELTHMIKRETYTP